MVQALEDVSRRRETGTGSSGATQWAAGRDLGWHLGMRKDATGSSTEPRLAIRIERRVCGQLQQIKENRSAV